MSLDPCDDAVCCWRVVYYLQQRCEAIAQILVFKVFGQLTDMFLEVLSLRVEIVLADEFLERLVRSRIIREKKILYRVEYLQQELWW